MENTGKSLIYYCICMLLTALTACALYTLRMKKRFGVGVSFAAATLLMMIVLGIIGAKLFFIVTQLTRVMNRGFLKQLISTDLSLFSFSGGMLGVIFAIWLSAKLFGIDSREALNLFAPIGALAAGLSRLCEGFLVGEEIGLGSEILSEGLSFFPFAVMNEWEEYYGAVFFLEAICCFAVALLSQLRFRRDAFFRTLFSLCLPQIICQSLLKDNLLWWFFLKVEQLFCVVVCVSFVFRFTLKNRAGFLPPAFSVTAVILIAFSEYALDKLTVIPTPVTYGIMTLAVILLGIAAVKAYRCPERNLKVIL